MSKSLPPTWLNQLFDNNGALLAGGHVNTYAAGTTTPLATYSDAGGAANTNPVVLDSAGRAAIYLTQDTAYKFYITDADGNEILTVDNIIAISGTANASTDYEVVLSYSGTPAAQAWMGGVEFKRAVSFPVDWDGSGGSVVTNPGADYVISIQKNGVEVGTATFDTAGVLTLVTTGGATVSVIDGDTFDFYGPASVGTAANFKLTLMGAL